MRRLKVNLGKVFFFQDGGNAVILSDVDLHFHLGSRFERSLSTLKHG